MIPPDGGWEEGSYYVVDVAIRHDNMIHKSILFVHCTSNDNQDIAQGAVYNGSYYDPYMVQNCNIHYIKSIRKINMED